ncbi:MAG TPA: TPM domain-containing protein [Candidatus Elarobacter sp.]|jgi:uncharacterized protein
MRAVRRLLALLMLFGIATAANGAEIPVPHAPARWATDTAAFLQPQTVAALDARLSAYERATGHQVLVYVTPSTGDTPTEDWTVRAFARWKVGRKGLDDGVVLFLFPRDRKVRIEVGYGLEQRVPDATAARIIRDTITPPLRAGRSDEAVVAGIDAILGALGGEAGYASGNGGKAVAADAVAAPRPYVAPEPGAPTVHSSAIGEVLGESLGILIGLLIAVGVIVLIVKLPEPKETYISSRDTGFGWGGFLLGSVVGGLTGGGFSGGGGSSGGGGATGSW